MSYYQWQWKEIDDDRDYIAIQHGYSNWEEYQEAIENGLAENESQTSDK